MRLYGRWAGKPDGEPEDPTRCIAECHDGFVRYQCQFKRGKGPDGLYCGTHARNLTLGRHVYVPKERTP